MNLKDLRAGIIVRGSQLPEPIEVLVITPLCGVIKLTRAGQKTTQVHQRAIHPKQIKLLEATPAQEPFDGGPPRGYAAPIVDHNSARDRALTAFTAVETGGDDR